ncbi:hypothetical protein [Halomarina litorea]|uniref:hypothetical protein n=1 Tax=Halomarina litorea TaxID=2961595 RepID=UPI0020C25C1E|nr:hypothetical protein [Halomarina sp. BCD28]
MSRQHSPRSRRTAPEPAALDRPRALAGTSGHRRVPADARSLTATLAMTLLAPLAVAVVAYPLTALAALLTLAALAAVARAAARRVAGRQASLAVPGLGLRLDVGLAER